MKKYIAAAVARGCRAQTGTWLVPLCLTALLLVGGCASFSQAFSEKKPEPAVLTAQAPAAYGVVTQVDSADMAGKELRKGDLAITVDLDDGGILMIIQPEAEIYTVGDRVRVFREGGFTRAQLQ